MIVALKPINDGRGKPPQGAAYYSMYTVTNSSLDAGSQLLNRTSQELKGLSRRVAVSCIDVHTKSPTIYDIMCQYQYIANL